MTSTPLVEGSNTESHNGVHEDLERIYTVITTPEERVVMKPFKSLFDEINTALVGHHLDPGSTAFRNLCMRWCRRAHEATRLLPRHLVIDCGCVVLRVWFRWVLRYCSNQVASHCRRIVEAFKERNDTCRALLECDEVVDVVTLSHDEVIQCVVDDADALYPLYLCDDEQPFHILRGALDDVVQIHALLDLLCTLGQQLSHHLGVHRADVKTIMSNALANLVTRPWIRRWVLLLVGAIHIHSPITAWMNTEDSLFQQWKMTNHRYVAPLENAFGALVKLTQRIFDDETRMTFVVIVAMLVLKEQMVRHVCPLAEWAVQMSTGGAVNEEDEWEDVKVDGDVSGVSDTDDAIPRAYQFLVELNDHVLKNLSFMSEWLCVGTAIREDLYEARTLEGRFLVLIFSFFIDPAIITSFDDPQLRSSFLFRLLELASLRVLERYLRSGENDVSPMCVSGDGGEEDDEGSAESADGSPTLESIFPFFSITNNTLLRTITQESDESDTGADMSTSEDSNPGEAKYYTDCRPDCQESDSDLHMLKTVFEFRQRILNANIRNYSQWHRLSLNSRPYDVWRVVLYTMGSLVVHSVETLLLETYSTATLVPSMDHDDDSVEQAQMIVSAGSHEEQRKRKEVRILSLIKVATQMARKLKILFEDSPYRRSYVVYFGRSYLVCFGMMNILASMSSVELDMYLCSITDAIHNYYLRIGGYSTWTREERDGVMQDASTHIKSHGAIAQLSHMDSLGDVGFEKRLDDFNTIHETDILNQECFLHGYELVALHTGFDNLLVLRKQMMETNPEWLRDDSSCCDSFIRIHDFEQLQSMLDLPIPSDQRGVFLRYMDAALRVRLLYRPLSTVLKHTTKARGTLSSHNSRTVSIRLLDACYWGFHPSTYFLMTQIATCASSSARPTTPQAQPSSDAEELPFPADLAAALVDYTHEYQQQKHHEQRQLHWCRNYAYTTFVLYYPQDGGLPTTIHGTLHLQRLFVALTGYKRVGVTWSRLAARAHVSVKELKQQLQKCVKLGLLVCVGKDDEGEEGHGVEYVAMNYDYVRPVESTDGVIEVWPECPRLVRDMVVERGTTKATSDAVRVEQLAPTVMSIMKQKKRVSYSELVDLVRAAVQTRFVPTPAMMKSCVEGLIDRKYLQRAVEEDSSHLASSVVVLEYMP